MPHADGQEPQLADRDAHVMTGPGAYSAALNWYRAVPLSGRGTVATPAMFVWSEGDKYVLDATARRCGRYVTGDYRFEILHGASHWMPDERPDAIADLLLQWFARHP